MQYIVFDASGLITNVVEWDGEAEWQPGDGLICEPMPEGAEIGGTYIHGVVMPAPVPEPVPPVPPTKTFEELVAEADSFADLKALVLANARP